MGRIRRLFKPGTLQHLISRFIDRDWRIEDQQDRNVYLRYVADASNRWDWLIVSYALMSTHIHMAAVAGVVPPVGFFSSVHTRFALYWHKKYGGLGPVFSGRPTNKEVPMPRAARLLAYQHLNPVSAKVVDHAADSTWTSHRAYVGTQPAPDWLEVKLGLSLCGLTDSADGRRRFGSLVEGFADSGLERSSFETTPRPDTGGLHDVIAPRRPLNPASDVKKAISGVFGTDIAVFHHRTRPTPDERIVFATVGQRLGMTQEEIGKALNVSGAAVSAILRRNKRRAQGLKGRIEHVVKKLQDGKK